MFLFSKLSMMGAAAGFALACAASAQAATPAYGSAVYLTARDCSSKTSTQACSGSSTSLTYQGYAGGPNQGSTVFVGSPSGTFGQSDITFGSGALPEIRQADAAFDNLRVNVNAFAYNSFTYEGDAATELSYAGDLHIVGSSGAPLGDPNLAGGAGYFTWIAIWDPSLASGFTSAFQAIADGYGDYDCSTPGVLGFGYAQGALSGGEQSIHIATQGCSGSPVMINPGQTVLAAAWLQTPVNRGGWVDASHTFTMGYDPALSAEVRANLSESMVPGFSGVPEPSTWAVMILGFGLVGAMARRRGASSPAAVRA